MQAIAVVGGVVATLGYMYLAGTQVKKEAGSASIYSASLVALERQRRAYGVLLTLACRIAGGVWRITERCQRREDELKRCEAGCSGREETVEGPQSSSNIRTLLQIYGYSSDSHRILHS